MAITETLNKPLNVCRMAVISHIDTGTVAAREFLVGFKPRYVRVYNETDGITEEWFEGMADAEGLLRIANGTASLITTNGITPSAQGFTLGLNTTIYITSKQYSILVFG